MLESIKNSQELFLSHKLIGYDIFVVLYSRYYINLPFS